MPNPTVGDVHIDQALTNISLAYKSAGFVADEVAPIVTVQKESDKYYVWDREDTLRQPEQTLKADGSEANEVGWKLGTSAYSAEEYALKHLITDRQRNNADSVLQLDSSITKMLTNKLMVQREKLVATALTTLASYATTNRVTKSGTGQWNDTSFAGDIEADIDAAKEAVRLQTGGEEANTITIPAAVAKVMKRDPKIRELIKYTHTDLLVNGDLPPVIFGLKVVIPKASYNTAIEGATASFSDIWGKNVVVSYNPSSAGIMIPAFAYTFRVKGVVGNMQVRKWRNDERTGDFVEVSFLEQFKIVSNVSGYLIKDVIN